MIRLLSWPVCNQKKFTFCLCFRSSFKAGVYVLRYIAVTVCRHASSLGSFEWSFSDWMILFPLGLSSKFSALTFMRCFVFLLTSARSFQSVYYFTFFYWPVYLVRFVNIRCYKFAFCRKNLDTNVTLTQNSLWKLTLIDDVHYHSSITFVTFVVCRSTILRRYLLFTTTPTSPLLRTRRSVCYKEYSRCSRARLQAREGHVRRWVLPGSH